MKQKLLKAYADLIVRSGISLKKGQDVVIRTGVENEDFTAMVVAACYKRGARRVSVQWGSSKVDRAAYKYGKEKNLSIVFDYEDAREKYMTDELPCLIWLDNDDPDALNGLDADKIASIRKARMKVLFHYRMERDNKYQWCIVGVPGKAWAKKVFPDLPTKKAIEKLWEAILLTSRALDGNGIENWQKHDEDLKARCGWLNSLNLRKLHYTSSNGTDLTVGLIPGVIFLGGGEKTLDGTFFQPNIPSEECFTSPKKGEAEGIVYSAKPLSYQGVLIENFSVRFEKGKAVEVHAEKGEEALRSILEIDEGSAYLGECALVPYDSPINNTGLLFYNTLFDENAACHLALGRGFTNLYPNYEKYSAEELQSFGINSSSSHVDFMIGSKDLNITGIDDKGNEIAIFRNGNWAR